MDLKMDELRRAKKTADRKICSTRAVAICKMLSILSSVFTSSVGCYGFYLGWHTFNQDDEIDLVLSLVSFYMLVFGLMILLAECKAVGVFDKFGFLASRLGRGIFSIFIGSLATVEGKPPFSPTRGLGTSKLLLHKKIFTKFH
jgi:hypothetical protein